MPLSDEEPLIQNTKMKNVLEAIRSIPTLLAVLPTILSIIGQARAVFGSDKMQDFLQALRALLHSFSDGDNAPPPRFWIDRYRRPVHPSTRRERRQRNRERRFNDFRNRMRLFGRLPESEVQHLCVKYHIQPYTEEIT